MIVFYFFCITRRGKAVADSGARAPLSRSGSEAGFPAGQASHPGGHDPTLGVHGIDIPCVISR